MCCSVLTASFKGTFPARCGTRGAASGHIWKHLDFDGPGDLRSLLTVGKTRPAHTRYWFHRMVVLKSWYLWLQRAIKFVKFRRLTKAVLTFFMYKLIYLILPRLLIAFCRSNIMRLTSLWSLPYLILKSPWEAVKVSQLCWSCVGAALAKPRAVFYGTCWDVVAGMMEELSFHLQPWSQWEFGKQSRAAEAASQGFIIAKKRQTPPPSPHWTLEREASFIGR